MLRVARLALFTTLAAAAQAQPHFDVASIKPVAPSPSLPLNSVKGGPGTSDPERIEYRTVAFEQILARALDAIYDWRLERPAWMRTQYYDITAKVPPGATKAQANEMMLNLLKERFHPKLRHETRQVEGYEFTVSKGGSKLKEAAYPDAPEVPPYSSHTKLIDNDFPQVEAGYSTTVSTVYNGRVFVTGRSMPVSYLFDLAFSGLGEPTMKTPWVDKTDLLGRYDVNIMFGVAARSPDSDAPRGPGVLEVFEKQLGLHLEKKRISLDVVVVDSADKVPVEN